MNMEDFIDYEQDQKEQGLDQATQAGALTGAMHASMSGTPLGMSGIKYWDDKWAKNEEITPYEAYLAKKFNDITFTGRLDINANTKTQSVTKLMGDISQDITALQNAQDYMSLIKNQAGFWPALNRSINWASAGIIPLSAENARYQNLMYKMLYDTAKSQAGGRPSNAAVKDMKSSFGGNYEQAWIKYARTGQSMQIILNGLKSKMDQMERQGYAIDPKLQAQYDFWQAMSTAAQDKNFQFDPYIKTLQNKGFGAGQPQAQGANPQNPYTPTPYTPSQK